MGGNLDRRDLLLLCAVAPGLWANLAFARSRSMYPNTTRVLRDSARIEMAAHFRYVHFSRKAEEEGYKGIAYLFTALATSELIHAQNYERILTLLGAAIDQHQTPALEISDTKTNLISAAKAEINAIKNLYPDILENLRDEGHSEALRRAGYCWESHRQHRDMIKKIRKWSPDHFETVAKRIDKETDRYFVCQICGSTLYEIPESKCPICAHPSIHYWLVDERTFL